VTLAGTGSVIIQTQQIGNGTYAPATPVNSALNVTPAQRGYIAYDQIRASESHRQ
jgi:hypothetical protein